VPDLPWQGDACSLVDAFRSGDRSPTEELEATLAAIEASDLNAFSHVDEARARATAQGADVSLPFGGVPTGIKELEPVKGWPDTGASLVYRGRVATVTSHHIARLFERGGVVPVGQTCASEFGGLNVSVTKLNGVTHNPWQRGRTAGGSSGGSASAVAGGLVSLATGGDGGGSIRIPAGYNGLLGMKGTFGRIPRSPNAWMRPNTVVPGNLARSVRDAARYFDVCAGTDPYDPTSIPSPGGWEAGLGTHDLAGRKVAVVADIGGVPLDPGVEEHTRAAAAELIAATGMVEVELEVKPPNLAVQWMVGNLATLLADLGPKWPRCEHEITDEIAVGLRIAETFYNLHTAAVTERLRVDANEVMAAAFEQVDFIMAATNPGPAFPAEAPLSNTQERIVDWMMSNPGGRLLARAVLGGVRFAGAASPSLPPVVLAAASRRLSSLTNMGGLTIISNIYGNPAVSVPSGIVDGLPLGLQVLGRHHCDELLFDVALAAERARPWPLVAPTTERAATTG
jgi:Asp-tRNA(Asn)/Glu-tRNA(Gln) amidotransferase A subunit family amidase